MAPPRRDILTAGFFHPQFPSGRSVPVNVHDCDVGPFLGEEKAYRLPNA